MGENGMQHPKKYRGKPKNCNLFIKKSVYLFSHISTSVTFEVLSIDAIHLLRRFYRCSKLFLNSSILMPFSASAIFHFTSSTSAECFPLRSFLSREARKKLLGIRSGE